MIYQLLQKNDISAATRNNTAENKNDISAATGNDTAEWRSR